MNPLYIGVLNLCLFILEKYSNLKQSEFFAENLYSNGEYSLEINIHRVSNSEKNYILFYYRYRKFSRRLIQ